MNSGKSLPSLALLAGGLATRMGNRAKAVPKSLFHVAGEPFIFHQLRLFQREGVRRVVVCAGHLGEMIVDAVGNGAAFGLSIDYVFDGPNLRGTGGALKQALHRLDSVFFVTYGDSYLPIDFGEVYRTFEARRLPALMTVYRNCDQWDTSNTEYADGVVKFHSKSEKHPGMQYIDFGLGILSQGVFRDASPERFDLSELYHRLAARGQLAGLQVSTRFYEIGSEHGLQELDKILSSGGIR